MVISESNNEIRDLAQPRSRAVVERAADDKREVNHVNLRRDECHDNSVSRRPAT